MIKHLICSTSCMNHRLATVTNVSQNPLFTTKGPIIYSQHRSVTQTEDGKPVGDDRILNDTSIHCITKSFYFIYQSPTTDKKLQSVIESYRKAGRELKVQIIINVGALLNTYSTQLICSTTSFKLGSKSPLNTYTYNAQSSNFQCEISRENQILAQKNLQRVKAQ